jgi:hypothetical protein
MVLANKVVASGWMEESVVVSVAGQRHSVIEGILTGVIARQENTHVSKVGERKESIDNHTALQPTTCNNLIGWHHTTETFSPPTLFPIYIPFWGYRLSFGFLNPEDRTDRLSQNVDKKLPLLAT